MVQRRLVLAQHQQTAWTQREMEHAHHSRLRLGLQVDQHIAAADHVEPGKRRIAGQVMPGEDDALAQHLVDLDMLTQRMEVQRTQAVGQRRHRGPVVHAAPGLLHRLQIQIGGEDLQRMIVQPVAQRIAPDHRHRIGLLAGGTARHPDPHRLAGRLARQHPPDLLDQVLEGQRIAPEGGDRDQRLARQRLDLARIGRQPLEIGRQRLRAHRLHTPGQAAAQRRLLVVGQIDAAVPAHPLEQRVQVGIGRDRQHRRQQFIVDTVSRSKNVGFSDRRTHRGSGPERNSTAHALQGHAPVAPDAALGGFGHAAVTGAVGAFHQHQSSSVPDALKPVRPVAAGARQHDAGRTRSELLRQRLEEQIDRRPRDRMRLRLGQPQPTTLETDVRIVRRDQHGVGPGQIAVADLLDRHAGVRSQDLCQNRTMGRRHVLQQHEAQAGIDRKLCEQQAQAFQPASRRPHADQPRQHGRTLRCHLHADRSVLPMQLLLSCAADLAVHRALNYSIQERISVIPVTADLPRQPRSPRPPAQSCQRPAPSRPG